MAKRGRPNRWEKAAKTRKMNRQVEEDWLAKDELLITLAKISEEIYDHLGGMNFDERDFQTAFGYELNEMGIEYLREINIELFYKSIPIKLGAPDFYLSAWNPPTIVELKLSSKLIPSHRQQLRKYLLSIKRNPKNSLGSVQQGVLINFLKEDPDVVELEPNSDSYGSAKIVLELYQVDGNERLIRIDSIECGNNQALKNKYINNNSSNNSINDDACDFINWLVPENTSVGIKSENNTQTAAFIILAHYCVEGLGFLQHKNDDNINATLNLISNHELLLHQISIKNHIINFIITRLGNPDSICYFLKDASNMIIDKYRKGENKPDLTNILINDVVRWRI